MTAQAPMLAEAATCADLSTTADACIPGSTTAGGLRSADTPAK